MKKYIIGIAALMTLSGLALGFNSYDTGHEWNFDTDWDSNWAMNDKHDQYEKKDKKDKQPVTPEKPAKPAAPEKPATPMEPVTPTEPTTPKKK